jgi:hypothetical protein
VDYKKRDWSRYTELVFLHLASSVGHILCFGVSGARNVEVLFFMLGWTQCGYHKTCIGTHYVKLVFLHLVRFADHVMRSGASGAETSMHYFSCPSGPATDPIKCAPRHVTPILCFCIRCDPRIT